MSIAKRIRLWLGWCPNASKQSSSSDKNVKSGLFRVSGIRAGDLIRELKTSIFIGSLSGIVLLTFYKFIPRYVIGPLLFEWEIVRLYASLYEYFLNLWRPYLIYVTFFAVPAALLLKLGPTKISIREAFVASYVSILIYVWGVDPMARTLYSLLIFGIFALIFSIFLKASAKVVGYGSSRRD